MDTSASELQEVQDVHEDIISSKPVQEDVHFDFNLEKLNDNPDLPEVMDQNSVSDVVREKSVDKPLEGLEDEPMDTTESLVQDVNTNGDLNEDKSSESNDTVKATVEEATEIIEDSNLNQDQDKPKDSCESTNAIAIQTDADVNGDSDNEMLDSSCHPATDISESKETHDKSISCSDSEEDCASELEKNAQSDDEQDAVRSDFEKENEVEEVIMLEPLDEIHVKLCSIEQEHLCFACKKQKIAKYSFMKTADDKNVENEAENGETIENKSEELFYVCGDNCYKKLEAHCAKINTPGYFDKKLCVSSEEEFRHSRKCTKCFKVIDVKKGVLSWEALDFCTELCLYRYQKHFTKKCTECENSVKYHQLGKYAVRFGSLTRQFCSSACLDARKKKIRLCSYCQRSLSGPVLPLLMLGQKSFCSFHCRGKFLLLSTANKLPYITNKDTTHCYICSDVNKDITKEFSYQGTSYYLCDDECLTVFKFLNNFHGKVDKCQNCWKNATLSHLEKYAIYYDGQFSYFCSKICQYIHIIANRRIVPCVWCKVKKYNFDLIQETGLLGETIYGCSLNCLNQLSKCLDQFSNKNRLCEHCSVDEVRCEVTNVDGAVKTFCSKGCVTEFMTKLRKKDPNELDGLPKISSVISIGEQGNEKKVIIIQEEMPPEIANKMCQVRAIGCDQSTGTETETAEQSTLTDFKEELRMRAVPVPIYVPQPLNMWNVPLPRAVPFPLIVPVPVLIPLTRDSSTEYLKTMKKEPVKTPRDPFEQELLMMAELVAAEKPKEEIEEPEEVVEEDFIAEPADTSFNEDIMQMALKMASDYQESAVDLEGALQANTITPGQGNHQMESLTSSDEIIHTEPLTGAVRGVTRGRGRGRGSRGPRGSTGTRRGRGRPPVMHSAPMPVATPPPPPEPVEKPDAHMCLKYTFGVNAWKQWVTTKNADLERSSRKLKLFKNDLLQMTADELNYSLCLFVNEVRKPNGSEYAPDTIYYLCLGIQQYLYECGRIDNIFCDSFYEKFTDCLDAVCGKFSTLYSDSHYIVTRVEEEHLWESKQLGAHSPFVLLTTLMFFNTKHFNLTTVEEHMQLSFSHIMKHWKRNPGQGGSRQMPAGGRNVLLRFYPPQNAQANARKKKVYEQQENEDNPLRCPVKLYEFYLSKCPESVKTRNDVFYLLPERSCVPESPVWYSTMALDIRALKKMLHRVKMVKEINVALLTN